VHDETGVSSGSGMVMGFAFGLVLGPLVGIGGPFGMTLGASIGLVVGAAVAQHKSAQ
jgi:hypothetical protein